MFTTVKDPPVKNGKYTLEYFHIVKSPVYSFRITGGLENTIAGKVNRILAREARLQAECYFQCTAPYSEAYFEYTLQPVYLTDHLITVMESISYFCGGAHPDESNNAININADNGRVLHLNDVLHLMGEKNAREQGGDWSPNLTDEYASAMTELLTTMFPTKMVSDSTGQACDYTDGTYWSYPCWYFCAEGLHIRPSFPHLNNECGDEDWSTIPYNVLKKYVDPAKKVALP